MSRWNDPLVRRWILWGILALTFLLVNVYRLSTAVIADDLMAAFQTTGAQLGTIHAMFFIVYGIMQIPTGVLVDRVGPRFTATGGAIVMNVGALWFALAQGYPGAVGGRFLIGLGASVIFVSILRFCASWYPASKFGTMNGLSFALAGIGGILATTPFAILVDATGWRMAMITLAAIGLVIGVITLATVRDSPVRAGFEPIPNTPEPARVSLSEARTYLVNVLSDRTTWLVGIVLFCTGGINLTLFGLWGIPYVVQVYDTSVTYASMFTLLGGVGLLVGPPTIGRLSDRLDRRTELIIAAGIIYTALLGIIAYVGDPHPAIVALAFFVTGALYGAFVLTYPIVKDRHEGRASGISLGTINGASFFGAAAFPALMGAALDEYWTGELIGGARVYTVGGYQIAFAIATLAGLVALACAVWLHWSLENEQ